MAHPAPAHADVPGRYSVEQYFDLVRQGVLHPDDRVELLEGVVVAMSPQSPRHAVAVQMADTALVRAVGNRAVVRCQLSFVVGAQSVPEPDVAVVPGAPADYLDAHPARALLVVEVAESALIADRLTKAPLYARAGILEYWIVNLAGHRVEVFRDPEAGRYGTTTTVGAGERLVLAALPDVTVAVDDLLPRLPR